MAMRIMTVNRLEDSAVKFEIGITDSDKDVIVLVDKTVSL